MLLQHIDYLGFIDLYAERIAAFHVKDAEWNSNAPRAAASMAAYQDWAARAGRFRSPGDGDIDFGGVFSRLAAAGYDGWAGWNGSAACSPKEDGAADGAPFIRRPHDRRPQARAFDAG